MGQVATAEQINVTLSAADGFWMVYLHTIRKGRGLMSRAAMTGTRFGMVEARPGTHILPACRNRGGNC
jgi:hypothetical protein